MYTLRNDRMKNGIFALRWTTSSLFGYKEIFESLNLFCVWQYHPVDKIRRWHICQGMTN